MLPIEIQGLIILEAGNIPLLCQISKSLNQFYKMDIIQYYATLPISPKEIGEYIKGIPKSIKTFNMDVNHIDIGGYFAVQDHYHLCSHIGVDLNKKISYLPTITNNASTDVEFITENKYKNYDLYTIYHILKTRNGQYIHKVLCDTFNYYCNLLTGPVLSVYLYVNISKLNTEYGAVSKNVWLQTDVKKQDELKLEIIDLINRLSYTTPQLSKGAPFIIYPIINIS